MAVGQRHELVVVSGGCHRILDRILGETVSNVRTNTGNISFQSAITMASPAEEKDEPQGGVLLFSGGTHFPSLTMTLKSADIGMLLPRKAWSRFIIKGANLFMHKLFSYG